jgi:maltose/maltodextrin transport system substrate-binding protein
MCFSQAAKENVHRRALAFDNPGALQGLQAIVNLMKEGVMPKGVTQSIMDQKMSRRELAMMINGPWDWANLRKSGVDFALAPIPGVGQPWSTVRRRSNGSSQSFDS